MTRSAEFDNPTPYGDAPLSTPAALISPTDAAFNDIGINVTEVQDMIAFGAEPDEISSRRIQLFKDYGNIAAIDFHQHSDEIKSGAAELQARLTLSPTDVLQSRLDSVAAYHHVPDQNGTFPRQLSGDVKAYVQQCVTELAKLEDWNKRQIKDELARLQIENEKPGLARRLSTKLAAGKVVLSTLFASSMNTVATTKVVKPTEPKQIKVKSPKRSANTRQELAPQSKLLSTSDQLVSIRKPKSERIGGPNRIIRAAALLGAAALVVVGITHASSKQHGSEAAAPHAPEAPASATPTPGLTESTASASAPATSLPVPVTPGEKSADKGAPIPAASDIPMVRMQDGSVWATVRNDLGRDPTRAEMERLFAVNKATVGPDSLDLTWTTATQLPNTYQFHDIYTANYQPRHAAE